MANIDEQASWPEVPLLATRDLVLGGEDGPSNAQAKALEARTKYLKEKVEKITDFTGSPLVPSAEWTDVPAHSDPTLDVQAQALADRSEYLLDGLQKVTNDVGDLRVTAQVSSLIWQGFFSSWPMGNALNTNTVQRIQIPCGVTHARIGMVAGTTISRLRGSVFSNALRITRIAGNASTADHVLVINLTQEETLKLKGKHATLKFKASGGSGYSGGSVSVRVQYSTEQQQPILLANGEFTNGNVTALHESITPSGGWHLLGVDIPDSAVQASIAISIPWSGVAASDDYVDIEGVTIHVGNEDAYVVEPPNSELDFLAKTRYQTTYPSGAPRGTDTEQGSVSAIANTSNPVFGLSMDVRFSPAFPITPQFIFQSPTSGTESRMLDKNTGSNVNGLAYGLSDSGVTISNNGAVVAGNRYLCHWTANVIF